MDKFTMGSLMAGTAGCGLDETGCLLALASSAGLVWLGTLNQFKMESMDFSLPMVPEIRWPCIYIYTSLRELYCSNIQLKSL